MKRLDWLDIMRCAFLDMPHGTTSVHFRVVEIAGFMGDDGALIYDFTALGPVTDPAKATAEIEGICGWDGRMEWETNGYIDHTEEIAEHLRGTAEGARRLPGDDGGGRAVHGPVRLRGGAASRRRRGRHPELVRCGEVADAGGGVRPIINGDPRTDRGHEEHRAWLRSLAESAEGRPIADDEIVMPRPAYERMRADLSAQGRWNESEALGKIVVVDLPAVTTPHP